MGECTMKKHFVSSLLAVSIVLMTITLGGCQTGTSGQYASRSEWITILAEKFNFDYYSEENPYYSDVTVESEIFPYVQSLKEWGVLSVFSKKQLSPEKTVTYDEVASTVAIAVGFSTDENGRYDIKGSINYAVEKNLIGEKNAKYLTTEECTTVAENAYKFYLNNPGDERNIVVQNENVVDLSDLSTEDYTIDGNTFTFSESEITTDENGNKTVLIGTDKISVDDTFIMPSDTTHPWGIAYTVLDIYESNGEVLLTVRSPTLEDLYEKLDVHTTVTAEADDVVWNDNISAIPNVAEMGSATDYEIGLMGFSRDEPKVENMTDSGSAYKGKWTVTICKGEYEKTWENTSSVLGESDGAKLFENSNFVYEGTPSIKDFNGSAEPWTMELGTKNKFSAGYKITGELEMKALTVTADIKYQKGQTFGVEYDTPIPESVSLSVSSDISSKLQLEGTLSEEIPIGTVSIPLGVPGLSVSVNLALYTDLSGSLQVKSTFAHAVKVEWCEGDKLRKIQESSADVTTEAALSLDLGADVSASLDAFGIEIVDAGVKAGTNATASASVIGECKDSKENGEKTRTYQEKISLSVDLYAPIITLYVGGEDTLLKKVGISGEWELVTKDKGATKRPLFEKEFVFWKETYMFNDDGEPVLVPCRNGVKLSNVYYTRYGGITGSEGMSFLLYYPDGWEITAEEVSNDGEYVTLTSESGASIHYGLYQFGSSGSAFRYQTEAVKVSDSDFVPGFVNGEDYSYLGKFSVAKLGNEDTSYSYAVINREDFSSGYISIAEEMFYYGGKAFGVSGHTGEETPEQDEKEIIAILSSFRVNDNSDSQTTLQTYTTKFKEDYHGSNGEKSTNEKICPPFAFDYPSNWYIENSWVSGGGGMPGEKAELVNSRGVTVTFDMIDIDAGFFSEFDQYQNRHKMVAISDFSISRVADSQLIPTKVATVDLTFLDPFAVVKTENLNSGEISYSIMTDIEVEKPQAIREDLSFWYGTTLVFKATSPDGQFTEQEEKEVIQILSSFRLAEN